MICPLCKGNKIDSTVTFTVDLEKSLVVIRNVPAKVCALCGAEWIDDDISEKLENIVFEAKRKHHLFEVVEFHENVA